MAAPVKVARQQTTPELSGTFRTLLRNLHQHAPELFGTLRKIPNPASGTYTNTRRLQNPPEPSETFRNQPSGTFRNLPPEPAPATRTGTHRSLSGLKTPLLAYAVGEKLVLVIPGASSERLLSAPLLDSSMLLLDSCLTFLTLSWSVHFCSIPRIVLGSLSQSRSLKPTLSMMHNFITDILKSNRRN